ncbi:SDR family oxidoreductase [Streptomyces sp. AV19]|nr:SDR family oxidoreductase [Streptomyces sp. AV19]
MDRTAATLGGLDVLVNNAGIYATGTVDELTVEEIDRAFAIHVRAVFVAVRAAVRYMPRGGRVITIGSISAERAPWPGTSLYSATKSALVGLTKGIARDLGPRGITAVLVQPGPVATEMNPETDAVRDMTALGTYIPPEHIAALAAHLAGDGGSYITGSAVTIDAGATA